MELRDLPGVDELSGELAARFDLPPRVLTVIVRDAVEAARGDLRAGRPADPVTRAEQQAAALAAGRPRRVVNATGVLLHTNLGRAPLAPKATDAAARQATAYGNLEIDVRDGTRTRRGSYVAALLRSLTGAEAAVVVNNNAGALLLSVAALAGVGGRVAVSRGEMIEIGGSFRLPELMGASGSLLVEIGTTNRTRPADYERVAADVEVLLKVHPSNYRVEGFAEEASYEAVAHVAQEQGRTFVADLGSGLLDTRTPWLDGGPPSWLHGEPGVRETLDAGADVVLFSGDKLLGGPQAGIAVGSAGPIARMGSHPLARALRVDGPTLASLAVTLEMYANGRGADIPFWAMATMPETELAGRSQEVIDGSGAPGEIIRGMSLPGAGSAPGATIPTPVIRLDVPADEGWSLLARHEPPVLAGRREGSLHVDLRSVTAEDDEHVVSALRSLIT